MLQIGPYELASPVFLAPMAGVTDAPFRMLCAAQGAGFAASEMISSDTLLFATAKTRHRVIPVENGLPHAVQIAGADPAAMAQAAQLNVRHGAEIIDINMGCPAKKVCNRLAGSALLSDPKQVKRIIASVVTAVDVPVTLKIRTGPTPDYRNGVAIARLAEREGIQCIAVHGRTRADKFKGNAEYDTIREIKSAVDIPVIANGDIVSPTTAKKVMDVTGADGVMIGRAAQGNPWIFAKVVSELANKPAPAAPTRDDVRAALMEHVQGLHLLYGEFRGVRIARKHIAWYCKGLPNATVFRAEANRVDMASEQLCLIDKFFEQPEQFASAA